MASVNGRVIGIKAEVLNDLASRFLINLSSEEKDPIKLCTYIELAHWYYLDLMRPEDPFLPACSLKEFMRALFQHCPWLLQDSARQQDLDRLITEWKTHKFSKPVRGAIVLNQDMTKCLLVQGTSGTSWGFPKGKLEEGEADIDAAVREVYEETGFDIRALIREKLYLEANVRDTNVRMYLIVGVAEETVFEPKTRNEIRNIQWFNIKDLPSYKKDVESLHALGKSSNNFFMIIPFIGQLRRWIKSKKIKRKGISANLTGPEQSRALSTPQANSKETSPQPKRAQSSPQQAQSQFQTSVLQSQSTSHQGTQGERSVIRSITTPSFANLPSHASDPPITTPPFATLPSHASNPPHNITPRPDHTLLSHPLLAPIASHHGYTYDVKGVNSPKQWIHTIPFSSTIAGTELQGGETVYSNPAQVLARTHPPHQQTSPGTQQRRVLLPYSRPSHNTSVLPPPTAQQYKSRRFLLPHPGQLPSRPQQQVYTNVPPPQLAPGATSSTVRNFLSTIPAPPSQSYGRSVLPPSTTHGALPQPTTTQLLHIKTWTNFRFDRDAIMNSYRGIEVSQ